MLTMERSSCDLDELVEFWTLLDEDRELLVGKRGATGLGFALLLKALQPAWAVPARAGGLP